MLIEGSAASSARPTLPVRTAFKYLPAGVAFAVMMVFGHGASAEVNHLSLHNSSTQTEKNKQLVLTAYQGLFGDHDLTIIDKYWAKDYIQHNPYMADGRDSVRAYVVKLGIEHWPHVSRSQGRPQSVRPDIENVVGGQAHALRTELQRTPAQRHAFR